LKEKNVDIILELKINSKTDLSKTVFDLKANFEMLGMKERTEGWLGVRFG
jgi:hypothetical protein